MVVEGVVVGTTVGAAVVVVVVVVVGAAVVVVVVSGPTATVSADSWSALATTVVAADRASTAATAMTPTRAIGEWRRMEGVGVMVKWGEGSLCLLRIEHRIVTSPSARLLLKESKNSLRL
jgi:hypothetical protein